MPITLLKCLKRADGTLELRHLFESGEVVVKPGRAN